MVGGGFVGLEAVEGNAGRDGGTVLGRVVVGIGVCATLGGLAVRALKRGGQQKEAEGRIEERRGRGRGTPERSRELTRLFAPACAPCSR